MLGPPKKSKKRHRDSAAEKGKRRKHDDESSRTEEGLSDSDQHLHDSSNDHLSSSEDILDSRESAGSSPYEDELVMLAEVVLQFGINFNAAKSKRKDQLLEEVLKAEISLRNTSGGIIKISHTQKPTVKDRDKWIKELHEKRKTLLGSESGENDSIGNILHIETKGLTTYIFVRKSSVPILTDDSHLRQRSEDRNYKVFSYSSISEMLNRRKKRCICANEEKFKRSYHLHDTLSYESITKEHKLLKHKGDKLAKVICDKLSDNIISFANTKGGTIYFGVEDSDATIKGQKIKDAKERDDIHHSIVRCMVRKFWVLDSGEEYEPKEHDDYQIKFFPIHGADEDKFVIAVHICAFPGAAVFKKKPECSVLDEQDQIVSLGFKEWFSLHKLPSSGSENDRKKLKRQNLGRTVYFTVEGSIDDIYSDLIEGLPGKLKLRPNHAMNLIPSKSLSLFIDCLNKIFKQYDWQGIAFIERCWGVNMGLSSTKPAKVICDILICSPSIPLLLISLTEGEANTEVWQYNKKLAAMLKRMLAQDGGCKEEFYIKPITLSYSEADQVCIPKTVFDESSVYPDTYQMCTEKYEAILKALVPVLARINSSVKGAVGEHLFNLLTKDQYMILSEIFHSPKLMITGPPGSGKTVLALERIHLLRKHNGFSYRQVLFVCSNKVLEAQVRSRKVIVDGKLEPLCLVYNYFGLISCMKDERADLLAWVKHIVIDEGQHFKQKPSQILFRWWETYMNLYDNNNPPSLWIFCDASQKIMKEPSVLENLPDGFPNVQLNTVIRTTGKIHGFIQRFLPKNGPRIHLGHDFEGEDVDVLVPKKPSRFDISREVHLVYMLISLLKNMVEEGADPGTIGVLFTSEKEKERYQKVFDKHTRRCRVRHGQALSKRGSIVFDTIRIFSGDDKDTIIGFCPYFDDKSAFQDNNALMVSLCSRAKMKLILILENEEVARSFGLANCMKERDVQWDKDDVIYFNM